MTPLVLGSGSPRRKILLEEAGYDFVIAPPDIEEVEDAEMPVRELTALNARLKARAVATGWPECVVIGADTLVLHEDEALGKPADLDEAAAMLARLNGQTHQVFTAVCLMRKATDQVVEFQVSTEVTFKNLSPDERAHYHRLIDPLDKAGAYAAQDHGELIIEKYTGSSTNVIGLPMERLKTELWEEFKVKANGESAP